MTRLLVARGRITVVIRDVEEDSEEFWDRAWAFACTADWAASLKRPHERKGVVY